MKISSISRFDRIVFIGFLILCHYTVDAQKPPNVILILTDDQGIGDLGCQGNPWLKTPNIDAFYEASVRMTDFHVSPYCTPTRAAIMTGRYPINNGAWATYKGRDLLTEGALTMAEIFKQNGYKTGIFGKWHLGDNYPVRPTDCGFDVAVHHKAGGVGELSDYWGNNYFDDVYFVNNEPMQFEGYCTDIWFEESMKFIDENKENPFFVYLPTNAPHSPWFIDKSYSSPYKELEGDEIFNANFYGMISNIDENFGKLEKFLNEKKLADNTILIFMTDNGTSGGMSADGKIGFNKRLRGTKGTRTEGGHRVPFFIRWKDGKISGGRDVELLAGHVDLIPTLSALCDLKTSQKTDFDGIDVSPYLFKKGKKEPKPSREMYVHLRQDWRPPYAIDRTCIMKDDWRLVNGSELYDIKSDPMQSKILSDDFPKRLEELKKSNHAFIDQAKLNLEYYEMPYFVVGNDAQDEIKLTIQHAIGEDGGIWKSQQVADGLKNINNTHSLKFEKSGIYEIACRRWPKECPGSIWGVPQENPKDLYKYSTIKPEKARISLSNQMFEKDINGDEEAVVFKVKVEAGKTFLVTDFLEGKKKYGVYYTYVRFLGES
ncbi:MAG: arylsulfatase [Reichenbachiella sp.]